VGKKREGQLVQGQGGQRGGVTGKILRGGKKFKGGQRGRHGDPRMWKRGENKDGNDIWVRKRLGGAYCLHRETRKKDKTRRRGGS